MSSGTLDIALVVRFGPTDLQWEELLSDPLTVIGGPGAQPRTDSRSPDAPVTVAALQGEVVQQRALKDVQRVQHLGRTCSSGHQPPRGCFEVEQRFVDRVVLVLHRVDLRD